MAGLPDAESQNFVIDEPFDDLMPSAGPTVHIADVLLDVEAADSAVAQTEGFFSCTPCKPHVHVRACTCAYTPCTCTPCTPCGVNGAVVASVAAEGPASRYIVHESVTLASPSRVPQRLVL